MDEILNEQNERIDELNINGYKIYQNTKLFRFGIDAVLLAAFAQISKKDKVIDLCSGSGIIPLLYLARGDVESVTAVEYFEAIDEAPMEVIKEVAMAIAKDNPRRAVEISKRWKEERL